MLKKFARVPVSGLIAQYNAIGPNKGADHLPATMGAMLSKSLTLRGFINYDFASEYYLAFLREVGAGISQWPHSVSRGLRRWAGKGAGGLHWHVGGSQLRQADRSSK